MKAIMHLVSRYETQINSLIKVVLTSEWMKFNVIKICCNFILSYRSAQLPRGHSYRKTSVELIVKPYQIKTTVFSCPFSVLA